MTLDSKTIDTLRDIPDLTPVIRDYYEAWGIRVFRRQQQACRNYLSPNRRDYYKILFISAGTGLFTLGPHSYYIDEPTILFLAPNTITSWKNLSDQGAGYYCLFKQRLLQLHPALKSSISKYAFFSDPARSVLQVSATAAESLTQLFTHMEKETVGGDEVSEEVLPAYLQLLLLACVREGKFSLPTSTVSNEFKHVHAFFELLEGQTAQLNYAQPIELRTVTEYAAALGIHANHLNALLKKHTGQSVGTHIRNRLLEEAKALLIQTDWPLQDIGYSLGFAERSNFSVFFKQHAGVSPLAFRQNPNL
jgi:AraC family transcriptional activator of pobA